MEDVPADSAGERCYQLTHDYLVHALRDWLTRKQRETRRGRAELRLAERAAMWKAKPEDRHLPSAGEWLSIRRWTRPNEWTETQRRMMKRGRWVHGTRLFGLAIFIALVTMATEAYSIYSRTEVLLESLPGAKVEKIPEFLDQLAVYPRWIYLGRLRDLARRSEGDPRSRLAYSLALLPDDRGQVDYLSRRVLEANPIEMEVLRDRLWPYRDELKTKFWEELRRARSGDARILPVAGMLARYDAENEAWADLADKVSKAMVKSKLDDLAGWRAALDSLREQLITPLAESFRKSAPDHIEYELGDRAPGRVRRGQAGSS